MRLRGNESGVSMLKVLIILAVLGVGINEGIKYLLVQMDFHRMKDTMEAKAAAAQVLKDDEILIELENRALELGLPIRRENFLINRDDDKRRMIIKTAWEEEVTYLWGLCGEQCTQKYRFDVTADEAYISK
ncbi:MAG: hypothetical protein ACYC7L_01780 [Nitrospirota bacterium]